MGSDAEWYVLAWVVPAAPGKASYFVHQGPYATREEAVGAARAAETEGDDARFVRVIQSAEAPTGKAWEQAEEIDR